MPTATVGGISLILCFSIGNITISLSGLAIGALSGIVLNASQMQKLQEVLVNRLSENSISDYFQTSNEEFLGMFLKAKH